MNKKKIIPIAVVVAAVTLSVLYFEVFRYIGKDGNRIEGSGTIEVTEVDISSKLAGRIINIARDEGEQVKHGEVLVRIAYEELDAQRLSVIANLNNAKKNMERVRDLYKSGSISKKDFDNMETMYRVAKAGYDQINAVIENAVIASPIDGVVLEKNLEIGEIAFPGTPVLTVADIKDAWIKIYVNEKQLNRVKLGQKAYRDHRLILKRNSPGRWFRFPTRPNSPPKRSRQKTSGSSSCLQSRSRFPILTWS